MKALLNIGMISAAVAGFLSATASAAEIPYTVGLGPGVQLTGIVNLDDSSGDVLSVSGEASGAVTGKFTLDGVSPHIELLGTALKLNIDFSRGSQRLSARLDACPASPDSCNAGNVVILWEK